MSVVAGRVGKVAINFTPTKLTSREIEVDIENVYVIIEVHSDGRIPTDSNSDADSDEAGKRCCCCSAKAIPRCTQVARVCRGWTRWNSYDQIHPNQSDMHRTRGGSHTRDFQADSQDVRKAPWYQQWIDDASEKLVKNLKLTVHNVHIRVECNTVIQAAAATGSDADTSDCAIGLTVGTLSVESMKSRAQMTKKRILLGVPEGENLSISSGFAIYCNLGGGVGKYTAAQSGAFVNYMKDMIPSEHTGGPFEDTHYIVRPIAIEIIYKEDDHYEFLSSDSDCDSDQGDSSGSDSSGSDSSGSDSSGSDSSGSESSGTHRYEPQFYVRVKAKEFGFVIDSQKLRFIGNIVAILGANYNAGSAGSDSDDDGSDSSGDDSVSSDEVDTTSCWVKCRLQFLLASTSLELRHCGIRLRRIEFKDIRARIKLRQDGGFIAKCNLSDLSVRSAHDDEVYLGRATGKRSAYDLVNLSVKRERPTVSGSSESDEIESTVSRRSFRTTSGNGRSYACHRRLHLCHDACDFQNDSQDNKLAPWHWRIALVVKPVRLVINVFDTNDLLMFKNDCMTSVEDNAKFVAESSEHGKKTLRKVLLDLARKNGRSFCHIAPNGERVPYDQAECKKISDAKEKLQKSVLVSKTKQGQFEVRFGDKATSKRMPRPPSSKMIQVNLKNENTRVVVDRLQELKDLKEVSAMLRALREEKIFAQKDSTLDLNVVLFGGNILVPSADGKTDADYKDALIALILDNDPASDEDAKKREDAKVALRAKLLTSNIKQLIKRAEELGVSDVPSADGKTDADYKDALIALILDNDPASDEDAKKREDAKVALHAKLLTSNIKQLIKRAEELGVSDRELEGANCVQVKFRKVSVETGDAPDCAQRGCKKHQPSDILIVALDGASLRLVGVDKDVIRPIDVQLEMRMKGECEKASRDVVAAMVAVDVQRQISAKLNDKFLTAALRAYRLVKPAGVGPSHHDNTSLIMEFKPEHREYVEKLCEGMRPLDASVDDADLNSIDKKLRKLGIDKIPRDLFRDVEKHLLSAHLNLRTIDFVEGVLPGSPVSCHPESVGWRLNLFKMGLKWVEVRRLNASAARMVAGTIVETATTGLDAAAAVTEDLPGIREVYDGIREVYGGINQRVNAKHEIFFKCWKTGTFAFVDGTGDVYSKTCDKPGKYTINQESSTRPQLVMVECGPDVKSGAVSWFTEKLATGLVPKNVSLKEFQDKSLEAVQFADKLVDHISPMLLREFLRSKIRAIIGDASSVQRLQIKYHRPKRRGRGRTSGSEDTDEDSDDSTPGKRQRRRRHRSSDSGYSSSGYSSSDSDRDDRTGRRDAGDASPYRDRVSRSEFVPDDEVNECEEPGCDHVFTGNVVTRYRRHHCRSCGHVFCNSCSSNTAKLVDRSTGAEVEKRVCRGCHDVLCEQ
eukprot:COSAG02_NODE_11_length_58539_cov_103.119473_26_plen_1413_part_00